MAPLNLRSRGGPMCVGTRDSVIMIGSRLLSGAGYTLKVPAIDLAEVGAGGGSLIRIDAGGALQIGPRSAGAAPGPVCYDRGGTEPTLTDANVVLGYMNPDHLVGGAVKLDAGKARSVIETRIAQALGMSTAEAAWGAYLIAASNMIRAIKAVSSESETPPGDDRPNISFEHPTALSEDVACRDAARGIFDLCVISEK
jgi:N-methylhydantoinase A